VTTPPPRRRLPARLGRAAPAVAVVASMTSVQAGAAVAVPLFDTFGVAGTVWLRLTLAAALLLVVGRPRRVRLRDLPTAAGLGLVMGGNTLAFSAATARIPLGVTVAVEFCGPLAVAAAGTRQHGGRRLVWPALALAGVLGLTRPWSIGGASAAATWLGLGLAALAGAGWAAYIVLVAHVGRRSEGLSGLAVALTAAALGMAPFGAAAAAPALRAAADGSRPAQTALALAGLAAVLVPLTAYSLEMSALRRMDQGVFGVWMALEPAIGTLVGLLALGQQLAWSQLPGVVLVVVAGAGAQRAGGSAPPSGYPRRPRRPRRVHTLEPQTVPRR
jgi:inner membrane transporter RhtA